MTVSEIIQISSLEKMITDNNNLISSLTKQNEALKKDLKRLRTPTTNIVITEIIKESEQ